MLTFLSRRLSWVVVVVFGLGGPFMGLVAARLAGSVELERALTAAREYFSEHQVAFERAVRETTEEVSDLSSLFLTLGYVSREQFNVFSNDSIARHPAIAALEWAPRVTSAERVAHEALGRDEGLGDYRIRETGPGGGTVVAPTKADYYPVFYVEPLEPNLQALGFDLSSESVRRAALRRAEVTGEPMLTDPIELEQQGHESGTGFLALLPVFTWSRTRLVPAGQKPDGFVVAVVRTRDLFRQILDDGSAVQAADMRFVLTDTSVDGKPRVLGSTRDGARSPVYGNWRFAKRIDIGGQRWELSGRPTQAYVSRYLTRSPLFLGVGVFFLWELVGGLGLLLVARSRDVAFRRQTRTFETALRSLTEGVVVADAAGRFVLFNDAAESILGVEARDVSMAEWSSTYGVFHPDGVTPFPSEQLPLAHAVRGEMSTAELFVRNPNVPQGVWISVSGTPLRDEHGAPDGGVVVIRDVTAARQAEARLRASFKQLEDLRYAVDQATLVSITNRAGTIIEANDKFC